MHRPLAVIPWVGLVLWTAAPLWGQGADEPPKSGVKVFKAGEAITGLRFKNEEGQEVDLSAFKDQQKGLVLFFFPKADTPGCTLESCGFRDEAKQIEGAGYVVLGCSPDQPEALKKFKEKHQLGFTLLSDPQRTLLASFPFEKGARKTVLIGKDGTVRKLYDQVSVQTHAKEILKELSAAQDAPPAEPRKNP